LDWLPILDLLDAQNDACLDHLDEVFKLLAHSDQIFELCELLIRVLRNTDNISSANFPQN
jgi:hypothetical protein